MMAILQVGLQLYKLLETQWNVVNGQIGFSDVTLADSYILLIHIYLTICN